jgi:hypothetical protein
MSNQITLITPPDIFENDNYSILLIGMNGEQQDSASTWLARAENLPQTNLYVYQEEDNVSWLFYAANRSNIKFVNLDNANPIITYMASYILSKPDVYYTTQDSNLKELMSYINNRYVKTVEEFLERAFDGK